MLSLISTIAAFSSEMSLLMSESLGVCGAFTIDANDFSLGGEIWSRASR